MSDSHEMSRDQARGELASDPVCGMNVAVAGARHVTEWDGSLYYFCCAGCKTRFEAAPDDYLKRGVPEPGMAAIAKSPSLLQASPIAEQAGHACCGGGVTSARLAEGVGETNPEVSRQGDCAALAAEARDPVCGMRVEPATAGHRCDHQGQTYYFCAARCREKFIAAPQAYLGGRVPPVTAPAGTIYTCPMHPQVQQVGPGDCPRCGMALEPMMPSLDEDADAEPRALARRCAVLAALTVPVFVVAMLPHLRLGDWPLAWAGAVGWIEALLASVVVLWGGAPFFARGWRSLWPWSPNMYTLIALGTGVAWAYSALAIVAPGLFAASMRDKHGHLAVYFESAAVIVSLVTLGDWLELRARRRTGAALQALLRLTPKQAHRLDESGAEQDVPLEQVRLGDRLRIRPGEHVPVDGVVLDGETRLDESMLTGESMPQRRSIGDPLSAGTLNGDGALLMRADKVGSDTLLAQIVALVASAQRSRAPLQRIADRVATWFVPAVALLAVLAFLAWSLWGPAPRLAHALIAAVSVLIIACPCALGLATPISIMVASGRAAQLGLLFRDAASIEALRDVDSVLLDKTGTLTTGKPSLDQVITVGEWSREQVLALAAALERGSEHPLARAVVTAAEQAGLERPRADDFVAVSGRGVLGGVEHRRLCLGNQALLAEQGVSLEARFTTQAETLRGAGATVMFLAVDGALAALLVVSDALKPGAAAAVQALRGLGLEVAMLSGDAPGTARAIAAKLGIETVHAGVSPAGKLEEVRRLQHAGRRVAMVGDGINDAPALAAAEVGVAMGQGTDVAMQSAGLTLVGGDLAGLLKARALSRATVRNIRQNLGFAFGYNALGVPLAAGVLYPLFGITLSPMLAALAMSLSSVSVVSNALRLRRVRL